MVELLFLGKTWFNKFYTYILKTPCIASISLSISANMLSLYCIFSTYTFIMPLCFLQLL